MSDAPTYHYVSGAVETENCHHVDPDCPHLDAAVHEPERYPAGESPAPRPCDHCGRGRLSERLQQADQSEVGRGV